MAGPYMPLWVGDYLGDTVHLTCEEHGAYLKLLMTMWRADGYLPHDEVKLARIIGVGAKKWKTIWGSIGAFFTVDGDRITQRRLLGELTRNEETSSKNRQLSDASRRAKRLKTQEPTLPGVTATNPIPNQEEKESENQSPEPPAIAIADLIWEDSPRVARGRSGKAAVVKALKAAVSRRKDPAAIRAALRTYYASHDATKNDGQYAKGVHRMIEEDRWEAHYQGSADIHEIDSDLMPSLKRQRRWMEEWTHHPSWWKYGPRGDAPDGPHCRISDAVMAEFGHRRTKARSG